MGTTKEQILRRALILACKDIYKFYETICIDLLPSVEEMAQGYEIDAEMELEDVEDEV